MFTPEVPATTLVVAPTASFEANLTVQGKSWKPSCLCLPCCCDRLIRPLTCKASGCPVSSACCTEAPRPVRIRIRIGQAECCLLVNVCELVGGNAISRDVLREELHLSRLKQLIVVVFCFIVIKLSFLELPGIVWQCLDESSSLSRRTRLLPPLFSYLPVFDIRFYDFYSMRRPPHV